MPKGAFGIVVSGGPAPGINNVIFSSTAEASNRGHSVFGLIDGFRGIVERGEEAVTPLEVHTVNELRTNGGSILGTSRFNPFKYPENREAFCSNLKKFNIDKLIVIGGEGSAYLSSLIDSEIPELKVAHVPKTIDNDLVLPESYPSFGFETARYVGNEIIDTLCVDAKTTKRWFIVTCMGRNAGFLALQLGLASKATLSIIPEEFVGKSPSVNDVAEIIYSSMRLRHSLGKRYGVAIVAEGVLEQIDPESSDMIKNCPRDHLGRLQFSNIELGEVLKPILRELADADDVPVKIYTKNIGYELRCHPPVSFDREYTRFLGYGAVHHLLKGRSGIMVVRDFDSLGYQNLKDLIGKDGKIKSRSVSLDSDLYKVARKYMFRND